MNNLGHYRKKAFLSQTSLAQKLDCTAGSVGHYENGRRFPDSETIKRIILALHSAGVECSFEDLFPPQKSKAA